MIVVGPDAQALHRREVQDPPRQDPGERALAAAVDPVPDVPDLRPHAVLLRPALRQAPEPRLDADHRALRVERGQQRRTGEGLDQDAPTALRRLAAIVGLDPGTLADTVGRWNRSLRSEARCGVRPDPDDGAHRRPGRSTRSNCRPRCSTPRAARGAMRRAQIVRPDGTPIPQAVQRRRTGFDLQLSVSGHRQYRRMPGVRPHLRPQRGSGNALGVAAIADKREPCAATARRIMAGLFLASLGQNSLRAAGGRP